ncbi:KipI antagonist [Sporosarcina sp. NCCP-2222]|uniref:5-oxoprolinase subunit C family protein n=1 Tax=Sporosarcina sp. NCCP-2222 TaxID=2935073 RepID=UPI00208803EA|nr:biotin-dependent carboxyltransferase family protein [Sporosarcina sp. NCCP-2222]GKV54948.1 KipI antagonist [Sporosarcina sp. NCCP-2222]
MITVRKAGLSDTIQDLGRFGYQKYGVVTSGAMDAFAHRVANLLVGNEETEGTLEMTLVGPCLYFEEHAVIALCGGDMSASIDGKPIPMWKPVFIQKGTELKMGPAIAGCRVYLAVAGGFEVPNVMGSYATYLKAGIGGCEGRVLKKGDRLPIKARKGQAEQIFSRLVCDKYCIQSTDWTITSNVRPALADQYEIRVIKGRQYSLFSEESRRLFETEGFAVSSQSDRMGYRLAGPSLHLEEEQELISEAVSFGSIQVPADGNPIILMADRQTTGGYPKIGQVASVDLSLVAQARPGNYLTFREISLDKAQELYLRREKNIQELKTGIALKFR